LPPISFSGEQQAQIPPAQTAADMGAKQLLNRERKGRGRREERERQSRQQLCISSKYQCLLVLLTPG